jgi:AcrR family transcriptional regulator
MSKKGNHYHHGDLRGTLLEVTARMIAEKGVESVTMRGLADQIGVSRTAPYRHFADKAALLAAVAEDGFNRLNARLREAKAENAEDALLSFRRMCLVYVEFAVENPTHYRLMFGQEVLNRQAYPSLMAATDVVHTEVVAVVKQCQQEQKIKPGPPSQLALAVWAMAHGLSLLLIDGRIPAAGHERKLAETTFETLLAGLAQ